MLALDVGAAEGRVWSLDSHPSPDVKPVALTAEERAGRDMGYDARIGPVAVVRVRGPIDQRAQAWMCGITDGYDSIERRFSAALSDVDVRAVVLEIDSPGGDAMGMVAAVRRMRAAAERAGKPVYSVADEYATSAAFALMMVADRGRMFVPPQGRTASIGTVVITTNEGPALEKEGVEVRIFRSGKRKMRPSGVESIDDATAEEIQARVDALAESFATWVAVRRGGAASDYLALQGASLSGEDAARRGLVDGTLTAQEVIEMAGIEAYRAEMAEAVGLAPGATDEQIKQKAAEYRSAAEQLTAVRGKLAALEAERIAERAKSEAEERAKVEAQKRAAFVSEVREACNAAFISSETEKALVAHYDAHGEASARSALGMARSQKPLVKSEKVGAAPVVSSAGLTPAQRKRAAELGATEEEYAASIGAKGGE
ncbi:MAG: hypothetical protein EKK62_03130 [Acidimicrobiia bacterium]|nr:MAG: hypothetical protein EKK62_03130 [Acidimicrobiia bacterium]